MMTTLAAQLHVCFVIIADELFEGATPLCLVIIADKFADPCPKRGAARDEHGASVAFSAFPEAFGPT
jgi:hypothetical protein